MCQMAWVTPQKEAHELHGTWSSPGSCQQPSGRQLLSLVFPAWAVTGWFAGDGVGTQLSGQQHRLCSRWPHPPSGWQLQSAGHCLPWTAHDNVPELLQDPLNLFISWNLTSWHSKIGSNFCGKKPCLVTSNFIHTPRVIHYCSYSVGISNWKEMSFCPRLLLSVDRKSVV